MRHGIALALLVVATSRPAFAQPDGSANASAATTSTIERDAHAPDEALHLRLGKALMFGVVTTALLVAGSTWRRARRQRR